MMLLPSAMTKKTTSSVVPTPRPTQEMAYGRPSTPAPMMAVVMWLAASSHPPAQGRHNDRSTRQRSDGVLKQRCDPEAPKRRTTHCAHSHRHPMGAQGLHAAGWRALQTPPENPRTGAWTPGLRRHFRTFVVEVVQAARLAHRSVVRMERVVGVVVRGGVLWDRDRGARHSPNVTDSPAAPSPKGAATSEPAQTANQPDGRRPSGWCG